MARCIAFALLCRTETWIKFNLNFDLGLMAFLNVAGAFHCFWGNCLGETGYLIAQVNVLIRAAAVFCLFFVHHSLMLVKGVTIRLCNISAACLSLFYLWFLSTCCSGIQRAELHP